MLAGGPAGLGQGPSGAVRGRLFSQEGPALISAPPLPRRAGGLGWPLILWASGIPGQPQAPAPAPPPAGLLLSSPSMPLPLCRPPRCRLPSGWSPDPWPTHPRGFVPPPCLRVLLGPPVPTAHAQPRAGRREGGGLRARGEGSVPPPGPGRPPWPRSPRGSAEGGSLPALRRPCRSCRCPVSSVAGAQGGNQRSLFHVERPLPWPPHVLADTPWNVDGPLPNTGAPHPTAPFATLCPGPPQPAAGLAPHGGHTATCCVRPPPQPVSPRAEHSEQPSSGQCGAAASHARPQTTGR